MNEADASPGNGAPATPPAPAEQPAVPAAPVSVTLDQVKGLMTEMLGGFKNAMFADMRKAGALKKDDPPKDPTPTAPAAAAPAPTGLTADEVQQVIDRRDAVTRAEVEHKLKPETVKRMRALMEAEKPADATTWVSSFVTDMGLVRQAEQPSTTTTPIPQSNGAPISDKGSPAPGGVANWEREFAEKPWDMSPAARALMDAKHGADKARKMRVDASQSHMARIKVVIPNR